MTFTLFGLTGGVASGKSSVARRFRERGLAVIDADALARQVVEPGSPGLEALRAAFGDWLIDPTGRLDRAALGRVVFADADKRRQLNAILHPRIAAATQERAQALEQGGARWACYEAALLVENGLADAFRPLVVVAAPQAVQLARLIARDGLSNEEAAARIAAQLPLEAKLAVADFVIDNHGDLAALQARADDVLERITGADALPPPVPAGGGSLLAQDAGESRAGESGAGESE
jgi:dephospho-CoA kinase